MSDQQQPYRAVLFDFFGTLTRAVRRGPAHGDMARTLGCDPDEWIALLDRTFYRRATGELGEPLEVLAWLATSLGGRPCRSCLVDVWSARVRTVRREGPLRDDAVATLRAVRRRGLRTAVVSDCWYELPVIMGRLPVAPLLDACVFSTDVGKCKPDPAMYLTACRQLGVDPRECVYVGDGGSRELTGADRLGMTPVRLRCPDLREHLTFHADTEWDGPTIGSLADTLAVLDREPARV
jgi:putative hydrolase of the HAD superfamily